MLRNDAAHARVAVALCTGLGVKSMGGGAMQLRDFMPWTQDETEATPENEMELVLREFGAR